MKLRKLDLNKYFSSVRRQLPCTRKQKKALLRRLRTGVQTFLLERPDATMSEIEKRFGTPQQIAATYITEMEPQEISQKLKTKRVIVSVVAVAIAVAVISWSVVVIHALINEDKSANGSFSESIIAFD